MGEVEFLSFYLNIKVGIMLIKVDDFRNSYWMQPYFFHSNLTTHCAH